MREAAALSDVAFYDPLPIDAGTELNAQRRDPTVRFYDPDAPLDKTLPEAISTHGLKVEERGQGFRSGAGHTLDERLALELGLEPAGAVLDAAVARSIEFGTDITSELVAARDVDEEGLAAAFGRILGLPVEAPAAGDRIVADSAATDERARLRYLTTCDERGRVKLFLAPRIDHLEDISAVVERNPSRLFRLRLATPSMLRDHRAAASLDARADAARYSLSRDRPDQSARHVLTGLQGIVVATLLLSALGLAIWQPGIFFPLIHLLAAPLFLGAVTLRLAAVAMLDRRPATATRHDVWDEEAGGAEKRRPTYSVLVALHRESEVVSALVRALAALDWPRSLLDVMLVCEGDDPETVAAVRLAIEDEPGFRIVVVPPSLPRTKPKALNFALPLATGDLVVLYDAEDRPRPDQLVAAARALSQGGERLACVQAPLVVDNVGHSWLADHFALEYAALFRGLLPCLARLGLPMPLGGTSNHFRRSALIEVGGWDSHNVTEDADLGIRLHRVGYAIGTIDSPTFEAAPERFVDWRNQRTRWMKGWMQTWLVHMRHPVRLARDLGLKGFIAFHCLFFGMIASTIAQPFFLGFVAYTAYTTFTYGMPDMLSRVLACIDLFNLVFGTLAFVLLATKTLDRSERPLLPARLWSLHAYWCLISLASVRAFGQLLTDPHRWEKTPHGAAARSVKRSARTLRRR